MLSFQVNSEKAYEVEIENALKTLLTPQQNPSLQLQALQREFLRKLQQAYKDAEENNKISSNFLSPWDNLPNKRNLEALARAGLIRTLPDTEDEDDNTKRSIANLAKNGQLPNYQINESKREMESADGNTEFYSRQDLENILNRLYNKRNIQNLARNFELPVHGKRSLASLIRNGDIQYSGNKNTLSSAQGKRLFETYDNENTKRNLASIKAQFSKPIKKDFESDNFDYLSPVYQNGENLMTSYSGFPLEEKRFLGEYVKVN